MFGLHLRTPVLLDDARRRCSSRRSSSGISTAASSVRSARSSASLSKLDRVPHQALVGVQDLQDLREGVRVGRDSRAEDHQERSACAATTASGSTRTRRSVRTT